MLRRDDKLQSHEFIIRLLFEQKLLRFIVATISNPSSNKFHLMNNKIVSAIQTSTEHGSKHHESQHHRVNKSVRNTMPRPLFNPNAGKLFAIKASVRQDRHNIPKCMLAFSFQKNRTANHSGANFECQHLDEPV